MSLQKPAIAAPQMCRTEIDVPDDARSLEAFKQACIELKLYTHSFKSGPGYQLFIVSYEDAADLIRLGCMFQTNLNKN